MGVQNVYFIFLIVAFIGITSITITEPVDGETYDGDWLPLQAIVENDNELPDSVHYSLNGESVVLISRLNTDWPTYMQNYLNHGYSESPAPLDNTVLWTAAVCGTSHEFCSPIVVDGVVYFVSDELSAVFAINATTGETIWSYDVIDNVDDAATFYEDKIYVSADSAWCLDALTGTKIWSFYGMDGSYMSGTPVVENGTAYFVSTVLLDSLKVHALDAETGESLWDLRIPSFFESCLALEDNILYMASWTPYAPPDQKESLFAVNAETGTVIWSNEYTEEGYWDSSPTIHDDYLYIGGMDGFIHAFNKFDGSLEWEMKVHQYSHIVGGVEPTAAFSEDKIFTGFTPYSGAYGAVVAYDVNTGEEIWSILDRIKLHGSIGLADDLAFLGEHRGDSIFAIEQDTGNIAWTYDVNSTTGKGFQSSPSITDGIMYIASTNGNLYAFGTGLKYTFQDNFFYAEVGANELIVTSFDGGAVVAADTVNFTVTQTGINLDPSRQFNLYATPNPFQTSASISFELAESGFTSIEIFDLTGRSVSTLANHEFTAGTQSVLWNGTSENGEPVSAGLYLCRIQFGATVETIGLCLLK